MAEGPTDTHEDPSAIAKDDKEQPVENENEENEVTPEEKEDGIERPVWKFTYTEIEKFLSGM